MGFPRQEYWSGLPFPSPEDLPSPGIKPTSPALAGILYYWATREGQIIQYNYEMSNSLKKKKKFISSPPSPIYIKGQFHSYLQLQSATFIQNFQGMSFICITLTKCKMSSIHQKFMGCINPGTDLDVPLNTSVPYTLHKQRANTCGVLLLCLPTWNR